MLKEHHSLRQIRPLSCPSLTTGDERGGRQINFGVVCMHIGANCAAREKRGCGRGGIERSVAEDLRDSRPSQLKSGDVKGTIPEALRYPFVSNDVRRHRLISISYISLLPCHGRGREFESRRPRHSFEWFTKTVQKQSAAVWVQSAPLGLGA
jgi:hypothetical protein